MEMAHINNAEIDISLMLNLTDFMRICSPCDRCITVELSGIAVVTKIDKLERPADIYLVRIYNYRIQRFVRAGELNLMRK